LLLEGALMAADFAPGLLRDYFGFFGWKQHDAACWQKLLTEAETRKNAGLTKLPPIIGFDQSRSAVSAAWGHVANAGLQDHIHIERRDISEAAPADSWQPGLVICNPPYGERLGETEATAELYKTFGNVLKNRFVGWKAGLIISDPELGFRLGIRSQKPVTLYNGALECKLLRLKISEEAFFIPKARNTEERVLNATSEENMAASGAEMFANRLGKNLKNLKAWAKQQQVTCYRIYDADLPEYAVAVDLYQGDSTWVNVQEYEAPKTIDQHKADQRLQGLLAEIPRVLGINREQVYLKIRRKQRSTDQYEKHGDSGQFHCITEGGCQLLVNFEDYLDTGLFLDHRPVRMMIQKQAGGKDFLNLFAYTGSASVHAAVGGAKTTTTVDMSSTYINWAKKNMALNQTVGEHGFIQADCLEWLDKEAQNPNSQHYDLIFLDPPTFSNSKRMEDSFDIQNDHVRLIKNAYTLLNIGGFLYFSTNFRRFKMDTEALSDLKIEDISAASVPKDFARDPKIHYCWKIVK